MFAAKTARGRLSKRALLLILCVGAAGTVSNLAGAADVTILNASYDVTRELYKELNPLFVADWKKRNGTTVLVNQAHAGSSTQARAVIDGLTADVVTMNQGLDIDAIAQRSGLLAADWAKRLPNNSVPFTSTILFLVRAGNPKGIKDWADLLKPGVKTIIPNPKTSGNGRYSYLAAWAFALQKAKGDEQAARAYVRDLFAAVPVLDTGGRAATTTFVQRGIGDVLLTFENEVHLAEGEVGKGKFAVVVPSVSVLAENPVAVVTKVAERKGTLPVATAYAQFLFTDQAQQVAAKHFFRPYSADAVRKHGARFASLKLVTIGELGGWAAIQAKHFNNGGVFDQIYNGKRRP